MSQMEKTNVDISLLEIKLKFIPTSKYPYKHPKLVRVELPTMRLGGVGAPTVGLQRVSCDF